MQTERYMHVRSELMRLYTVLTEQTFTVIMPASHFLTLKQLEYLEENPPLTGFETLDIPTERPFTIARILDAFKIMGGDVRIDFRYPRKDIPVIYESIQDYIRLWCEIKEAVGYLQTPPIEELEQIEQLARYVYTAYTHYHYEKINKQFNVNVTSEMTLLDVIKGRMMYGDVVDEGISHISYTDLYKSAQGFTEPSSVPQGFGGFGGGF